MGDTMNQAAGLKELGRRLGALSRQARIDLPVLAGQAGVPLSRLQAFERGSEPLGLGALCRLADVLGVPASTLTDASAPDLRAPQSPDALLLASGTADLSESDRQALAALLRRSRAFEEAGRLLRIRSLSDAIARRPAPETNAHRDGYLAARSLRNLMPDRPGPLTDLARLIESRFDILVRQHEFTNPRVLGASCRSGVARLIAVNSRLTRQTQRRFVLAHELAHHLLDLSEEETKDDQDPMEGAGFWMENPPVEKRANAFAAMFLAPEDAVRALLGPASLEGYGLNAAEELARIVSARFGLSFSAAAWHLHNLQYIRSPETVQALLVSAHSEDVDDFEHDTLYDGLDRRLFEARERDLISDARRRELQGSSVFDSVD